MAIYNLLVAAAGTPTSATVAPPRQYRENGIFQCVFSATGTVVLEGSCDGTNWDTVTTIANTDSPKSKAVSIFPYMRARVTASTGNSTAMLCD
jgi:hypothetical protein